MGNKKYPKIYIGPMSKNIVDAVSEYANNKSLPIGLIPSRRQIEYDGGYVNNWTTEEFADYVKKKSSNVFLQRDHGGRLQGQEDAHQDADIISFRTDCKSGFNLVHVDPWKKFTTLDEVIRETAKWIIVCNCFNPSVEFEVGTEEAIKKYTTDELDYFLSKLREDVGDEVWTKVKYAVIQTGTRIVGTKNVGVYDNDRCKRMIDTCNKHGLMSKEHNGDYLSESEIHKRFSNGLSALNIAPEFGVLETEVLLGHIKENVPFLFNKFFKLCYNSKKWVKWLPPDWKLDMEVDNREECIRVSGHYVFAHKKFDRLKDTFRWIDGKITEEIKSKIESKVRASEV